MKTQTKPVAVALPLVALLTACPNPADKAPKAKVGETPAKPAKPATPAGSKTFKIDASKSKISFVGSKVTGKHEGGFKVFSGTIQVDPTKVSAAKVQVEIDMDSTWSDAEKLTGHLKAPDFFDVAKFPKSTFMLDKVESAGGKHNLTGTLELHGVKKSISFPATINVAADKVTANAEFSLNRKDFGISYPGKKDDLIRDDVLIKLDLVAM